MSDEITTYGPVTPIENVVIPREGPRCLAVTLNFTNTDAITIEGLLPVTTGKISYIQGAYIDNGDNPEQLTIVVKTTQQRLIIPAYGQGYYPILFSPVPDCVVSTTQAALRVYIHFYNVPIQSQFWLANDTAPASGAGDASAANQVLEIAALDAIEAVLTPGAWTNRSIANLSGTSQTLMAANANRRHLLIQNVAANNMGVNLAGGTAAIGTAGTITLAAGASLEIWDTPPIGAITIIGTVNDDVTAYEG